MPCDVLCGLPGLGPKREGDEALAVLGMYLAHALASGLSSNSKVIAGELLRSLLRHGLWNSPGWQLWHLPLTRRKHTPGLARPHAAAPSGRFELDSKFVALVPLEDGFVKGLLRCHFLKAPRSTQRAQAFTTLAGAQMDALAGDRIEFHRLAGQTSL